MAVSHTGEVPAHENLAVRLHSDGSDEVVYDCIKSAVQSAIDVKPRDEITCLATNARKFAAHENLAVRLHSDGINGSVGIWVKSAVETAVGIEPRYSVACLATNADKATAHDNLAVRLHGDGPNLCVDIDRSRERAINRTEQLQVDEEAANENPVAEKPAAGRRGDRRNPSSAIASAGDKSVVGGAVTIKPRNEAPWLPTDVGKSPADQNFTIWLDGGGPDEGVRAGVATCIESTIGIEPRYVVACLSANARKISAQESLAVRLHSQCQDDIVCVRIKTAVRRAIGTQARDSVVCLGGWGG